MSIFFDFDKFFLWSSSFFIDCHRCSLNVQLMFTILHFGIFRFWLCSFGVSARALSFKVRGVSGFEV